MKKYKVGVIGLGDISRVYIGNLKKYPIVEVVACASRGLDKAKEWAEKFGISKPYGSADELIADPDIDIILNLTIPEAHAEINLKALQAGKHLYTEKPLGATYKEAKAIMTLAAEKGLRVGSAPDTFLGGRLQTMRKAIDEGVIGRVIGASAFVVGHGHEWFHPNPGFFYKHGGGPLLDIGPYYITALLSLLGPAKSCSAMTQRAFDKRVIESEPKKGEVIDVEVDTHITGTIRFANGAVATLIASFDVWDSELPRIEIYGTKGTLCVQDINPYSGPNLFGGKVLLRNADNYRWKSYDYEGMDLPWLEVPVAHRFNSESHAENSRGIGLVDMAYAIAHGRAERASGAMALHSVELMEGMLESAAHETFYQLETAFERPDMFPEDFPDSEEV